VNLIIDSLAALALATEPPTLELLDRPPQGRDEYIISRKMLKQIIPMACYMVSIMWAICFGGERFFPEPDEKFRFDRVHIPYVYPGRRFDWDGSELFIKFERRYGSSRHLSNVFNVFVVMTIFNILNARIINDKFNIFKGVFNNPTFCIIFLVISGAQGLIINVGSDAMKITRGGLHGYHWLIACIFGFTTWIMAALFKCIPDHFCPQFGKKNQTEDEEFAKESIAKKNSSQVKRAGSSLRGVKRDHGRAHLPPEGERYVMEKASS
jgi:magnesium-transporting ATPase (P-type)